MQFKFLKINKLATLLISAIYLNNYGSFVCSAEPQKATHNKAEIIQKKTSQAKKTKVNTSNQPVNDLKKTPSKKTITVNPPAKSDINSNGVKIEEIRPGTVDNSLNTIPDAPKIIVKNNDDQVDDLDISTYSYLDNIETSVELLNLILKSNCSKAPDNCKDDATLSNAAKAIVEDLKQKHPIGSRLISESQAKYLLMNSPTLKDQLGENNIEKISRLKKDLKDVNQFVYKDKEAEIIKRWKGSQAQVPRKIEATIPEVNSSVQATPGVNPANEKIVFVSERDGNPEIYTMNTDGTNQTRLTDNNGYDIMPAWSPDGTKIVFVSERDGNPEIYMMNADGTNQTRLTSNSSYDYSPSWSPDGTRIAFVSNRENSQAAGTTLYKIDYKIFVMNVDGSSQTTISANSIADESPKWSPDGKKIAFVSKRDGNAEIYTMNADGSDQLRLTNNNAYDLMPGWSPDSSKIAFRSDRDGNPEIYVMNADGTKQVRLTDNTVSDEYPAWSPDGTRIIFVSKRDNVLDTFGILTNEIYVMNADGTNIVRLTNNVFEDYFPNISRAGSAVVIPVSLK